MCGVSCLMRVMCDASCVACDVCGCADGVTVIAAAERGMHGHGVEVSARGVVCN